MVAEVSLQVFALTLFAAVQPIVSLTVEFSSQQVQTNPHSAWDFSIRGLCAIQNVQYRVSVALRIRQFLIGF